MNVGQLMNRTVETCRHEDDLALAASRMWDHDVGCLPVTGADGRVCGMLTDRDICMAAYTQGRPLSAIPVQVAMSKAIFCCGPDDALIEAEELMRSHQVRRLAVVDAAGALVGVISLNDLAREAEREAGRKGRQITGEEVSATLAAVCAPRNTQALTAAA